MKKLNLQGNHPKKIKFTEEHKEKGSNKNLARQHTKQNENIKRKLGYFNNAINTEYK